MKKIKLNDRTVTATQPELPEGKTDHIFFDKDDRGFGLRVRDTGSKIWVYQYSRNNKTRRMIWRCARSTGKPLPMWSRCTC